MTVVLAAADGGSGGGLAALVIVVLLVYAAACTIWPDAPCWRCDGRGYLRSPTGRYSRECPTCGGRKRRPRAGRRVLTALFTGGNRR